MWINQGFIHSKNAYKKDLIEHFKNDLTYSFLTKKGSYAQDRKILIKTIIRSFYIKRDLIFTSHGIFPYKSSFQGNRNFGRMRGIFCGQTAFQQVMIKKK